MLPLIRLFFGIVLVSMLAITTLASLDRSLIDAWRSLWPDLWFKATLADAYFAFLTIYLWMAYRERSAAGRVIWLVLVLALGNIAIAIYALLQLRRVPAGAPPARWLLDGRSLQSDRG